MFGTLSRQDRWPQNDEKILLVLVVGIIVVE
jgi:hypothetical protein